MAMTMLRTTLAASLALAVPTAAAAQASAAIASGAVKPSALAPSEIVAAAPASDWIAIAPSDLLVMTLAPPARGPGQASRDPGSGAGAGGNARQVVIQLMPPPFSQGWIGNIRKLAAAHWWDGLSINRVQDNYVVQWGDANAEDKATARSLPDGLTVVQERYPSSGAAVADAVAKAAAPLTEEQKRLQEATAMMVRDTGPLFVPDVSVRNTQTVKARAGWHERDAYVEWVEFDRGWPVAAQGEGETAWFWPVHCYGMVGVGRDLAPDTGSGAELYTVIGHAPRHLDRNIALVGRVVEGIEHLSSLPRGTGALGFYETAEERVPILSIRPASELPTSEQPRFQYLSTKSVSFARYADARANRRDPFFNVPAGGADICNIPVPIRRAAR